jgi:Pyruvate/2-oxoacid:ferredoxin oxidoreductase delta subunit
MSCGYCMDCEKCWMYCQDQAVVKPMQKGVLYTFKLGNCTGCAKCAEICPCGFIEMA